MAGYKCPACGKQGRLPSYCCGESMVPTNTYYCDQCKSQSNTEKECCGSAMRLIT